VHNPELRERTADELKRARRDLALNLGLISPRSPVHIPVQRRISVIDAELKERRNQQN
jgi:hypothetical protein